MSFILDALKKTEQERQRVTHPSIHSQHRLIPAHVPVKSARRIYLIVAAMLLLNAGVLLWWLKPWQNGQRPVEPPLQTEGGERSIPEAAPGADRPLAVQEAAPLSPQEGEKERQVAEAPVRNVERLFGQVGHPEGGGAAPFPDDNRVANPVVVARDRLPEADPADSGLSLPGVVGGPENPALPLSQEQSVAVPDQPEQGAVVEPETAAPEIEGLPADEGGPVLEPANQESGSVNEGVTLITKTPLDYRQLPPSLQQQLPELTISLHLYAENPEHRKVNIDGRMRREKEQIDKDLLLEEITPDGVIFNYAGRRFHKKVFR